MTPLQSAFVIGRRDFVATVWSRTYALFLIGPLLIIALSFGFGSLGGRMAQEEMKARVAVVASEAEFEAIAAARERVSRVSRRVRMPELERAEPDYDLALQTQTLLGAADKRIVAVLTGGIERPRLTGAIAEDGDVRAQMRLILNEARQQRALDRAGIRLAPIEIPLVKVAESAGSRAAARATTARAALLLLFMLTVFLATMLLSNLVEEKSSKVIEVLAAAAPVDAIFVGKLFAMLCVSVLGIVIWGIGIIAALLMWPSAGGLPPEPAVGWPLFTLLVILYYSTNYLLLGALFLGIGSQAATVREVQTLSMPVTIGQMLVFFFAMLAVGPYNSLLGIAAAVFPFSSPLAMVARAAQANELWTHALALLWQLFWVWLTIQLGAHLFRRNVLKSGGESSRGSRWRGRAA